MKNCKFCQKELSDEAVVCPGCGNQLAPLSGIADKRSFWLIPIGLFVPLAGFILYVLWREIAPRRARFALLWSVVGFAVSIALYILSVIIHGAMLGEIRYF